MKGTKNKTGRKDLKLKRDPHSSESQREMIQQGPGSSGEPLGQPVATSEHAVEFPVESWEEPVIQYLPAVQQNLLSWESVVLAHHCRELALPVQMQ
jgi:hypothetical protein